MSAFGIITLRVKGYAEDWCPLKGGEIYTRTQTNRIIFKIYCYDL